MKDDGRHTISLHNRVGGDREAADLSHHRAYRSVHLMVTGTNVYICWTAEG